MQTRFRNTNSSESSPASSNHGQGDEEDGKGGRDKNRGKEMTAGARGWKRRGERKRIKTKWQETRGRC